MHIKQHRLTGSYDCFPEDGIEYIRQLLDTSYLDGHPINLNQLYNHIRKEWEITVDENIEDMIGHALFNLIFQVTCKIDIKPKYWGMYYNRLSLQPAISYDTLLQIIPDIDILDNALCCLLDHAKDIVEFRSIGGARLFTI